jgi:hypothetical protein
VSEVAVVGVRRAGAEDRPAVLELLVLSLGFARGPEFGDFLTWRRPADSSRPPRLRDMDLSLGDVEPF